MSLNKSLNEQYPPKQAEQKGSKLLWPKSVNPAQKPVILGQLGLLESTTLRAKAELGDVPRGYLV